MGGVILDREIEVGDKAKDFALKDQNGKKVVLSDFEGNKVLLSFHPLAWTSVCAKQMSSLEKNYERLKNSDTVPLGISVDPVPSKKAWAENLGLEKLKILSDFWPHGEVAKKYGIFKEKEGFSERANIVINKNRKVEFFKVYEISEVPDIGEIINVVR